MTDTDTPRGNRWLAALDTLTAGDRDAEQMAATARAFVADLCERPGFLDAVAQLRAAVAVVADHVRAEMPSVVRALMFSRVFGR